MPAYIRILLPWDSQPQEVVGVDWNNPLAGGLLIAILPQLPVNLADGVVLSAYGTRVVSGGARGMMNTSGGMLLPAPANASDPSAKYDLSSGTALVVAVQSTETNTGVVFNRGKGSSAALWAIGLHGGSFDGAFGNWGNSGGLGAFSGGPVPTVPRVATITADGATARVYLDGVELQSGAYTPGTPDYDTANLRRVIFGLDRLGANTNTNTFLALLWNRPLSVTEVKEVSANPWQIFAPRSIWIPVSAGGGPTPVTAATETDTALTLSATQIKATGTATETDTAQALAAKQIAATGIALEADVALALTPKQIKAVGVAIETDTALALSPGASNAVGTAAEIDTALALTGKQIRAVGLATETDTALALPLVQAHPVGVATEADVAFALTAVQRMLTGIALETNTALALSGSSAGALSNAEMRQMYDWVHELALLHGLIAASPLSVTPTARNAGTVAQTITDASGTVTVTRT